MTSPEISILTVNYKAPEHTDRMIKSIREFPPPCTYEIIVVDNNSGDNSVELLGGGNPDIKLIPLDKNIGFGAGNNRAAESASGKILVLINPDSVIEEGSFWNAIDYARSNKDVGVTGVKVVKPDGSIDQTARGFPDASTGLFGRSTFLGKISQKFSKGEKTGISGKNLQVDPAKTEPYTVDWVAGTVMFIRREVWDELSGFDEDFFLYWEDADLCYRATKLGYKIMYYPGSRLVHVAGVSAACDPAPSIMHFHRSAYHYVVKHLSPGPSFLRGFAWCALNLRAQLLIAKSRLKKNA